MFEYLGNVFVKTTSHIHASGGVPHHARTEIEIPVSEGHSSVTVTLTEIAKWFAFADPDVATQFLREVADQLRECAGVDPIAYTTVSDFTYATATVLRKKRARWSSAGPTGPNAPKTHGGTNPARRMLQKIKG